jgi:hypothetical protein
VWLSPIALTPWELLDPAQTPFKGNWSPLKLFFVWRIDQCAKYYLEEQREALGELLDFGTAVFSAGLVVAVLKGFVDLVT